MKALTQKNRELLLDFAYKNITTPAETAAVDALYDGLATDIRREIDAKFPPADMAVLKKYDVARLDYCINRQHGYSQSDFTFRSNDERAPLLPNTNCSSRYFNWPDSIRDRLKDYRQALEREKDAKNSKLANYRQLILGSKNFNELVKIWPAAEQLRSAIVPSAPSQLAIPTSVTDFIRQDNAGTTTEATP